MTQDLDPEDAKLVTLARATRARTDAAQGAALRDLDGRTYAAAAVDLEHLRVSAVGVAVAMAISSGAKGVEAMVVLGNEPSDDDLAALRDFAGAGVPVRVGTPLGEIGNQLST